VTNPFLSIILPAHNEEQRLPATLKEVDAFLRTQTFPAEILVVENGSADRTLEIANEYCRSMPALRVISMTERGKGRAVQRGMLEARGEYRFFADVDFSMPVAEVLRFVPPQMQQMDIAIGSREAPGSKRYGEPLLRHLSGRVFNNLVRWLALPGLQDTQCGFKCFRAEVVEKVFPLQTIMGWTFDVEVLYIARLKGYKVVEIGIPWYYNPQSKVRVFKDSLRMFKDLLTIRRNGRSGKYG
jgi:dolichyl-phosphate beta-glucosyltransferase